MVLGAELSPETAFFVEHDEHGGFEVFDNFLGENIGIAKVIGFFEVLGSEIVL